MGKLLELAGTLVALVVGWVVTFFFVLYFFFGGDLRYMIGIIVIAVVFWGTIWAIGKMLGKA